MYQSLKSRYEPDGIDDYVDLTNKFLNYTLDDSTNEPEKWFHQLENIRSRMKGIDKCYAKSDIEMKAFILNNLPEEYSELITSEIKTMKTTSLDEMKKGIMKFYLRKFKNSTNSNDVSLSTTTRRKYNQVNKYKNKNNKDIPTCECCGKKGHKKSKCFHLNKKCNTCGEEGHLSRVCKKKRTNISRDSDNEEVDFVGKITTKISPKESWLADSGSTVHLTENIEDLINVRDSSKRIEWGGGKFLTSKAVGDVILEFNGVKAKIKDVLCVPNFNRKIISITKMLEFGGILEGEGDEVSINNKNIRLSFKKIKSDSLFYLYNITKIDSVNVSDIKKMDINRAHEILGHINKNQLIQTAKINGIELTGKLMVCEGCSLAKSRAKSIKKITENKSERPGERLFIDTSGPFSKTIKGNRYWIKIVDDYSRYSWSRFVKKKSELPDKVISVMKTILALGYKIKKIRMDNAGENTGTLVKYCNEVIGDKVELTPPKRPEYNGVVERRFSTDHNRALAMLLSTDLTKELRNILWAEAANTSELIGNRCVTTNNSSKSPYELFYNKKPESIINYYEFGRIAYLCKNEKLKKKWEQRSIKYIFIGYSFNDHAINVYRLYNSTTRKVILSRDVKWSDWNRKLSNIDGRVQEVKITPKESSESTKIKVEKEVEYPCNNRVNHEELDTSDGEDEIDTQVQYEPMKLRPRNGENERVLRSRTIKTYYVFNTEIISDPHTPKNFKEAMSSDDMKKWKESMKKEIMNFIKEVLG